MAAGTAAEQSRDQRTYGRVLCRRDSGGHDRGRRVTRSGVVG
jgi:hypothetical protein